MEAIINLEEIREIIPHRYPFLLVDRVTEVDEENGIIRGYKNITANEPVFQGHFPNSAVFPGVMILEALGQLGAIFMLRKLPKGKRMAYFAGIDKARFKRLVVPGDRLDLELKLVRQRGSFSVVEAKAYVDGKIAAEAQLMSSIAG